MCEPVSIGIMLASSAGLQAFSAYGDAKSQKGQANFAAGVADNNAVLADAAAVDAVQRGGEEANKVLREGRKIAGQQRLAAAASGVDVKTGAPAQLVDETDFFADLDATTVRNNAARAAWGNRQEAQDYRSSAAMNRAVAKASKPGQAAAISLLGSAVSTGVTFGAAGMGPLKALKVT